MDTALDRMLEGFEAFRGLYLGRRRKLFTDLVENGQHPKVLVIGCSDSRVDPALLTNAKPGDMFVVRNVAAIVPPYEADRRPHGTSSAIEFAVRGLGVDHVVVLGHEMCGGVRALGSPVEGFDFLGDWVELMAEVRDRVDARDLAQEVRQRALELGCVIQSLRNLVTYPWIMERVRKRVLTLHGWYFDLHAGQLLAFDPALARFVPTDAVLAEKAELPDACGPRCACAALRDAQIEDPAASRVVVEAMP